MRASEITEILDRQISRERSARDVVRIPSTHVRSAVRLPPGRMNRTKDSLLPADHSWGD
ncbi:hypothetical protein [Streptomyces sp. NPDC002276]